MNTPSEELRKPSAPPQAPQTVPAPGDEELVYYDDRVIGRAFRWSAIAFLVMIGAGAALFVWINRAPAVPPPQLTELTAPSAKEVPLAEIPEARFTDITRAAGIDFVHHNGAYGDKLLPETMGGGVAFLDYDNDGYQDLLFINSTDWPWHTQRKDPPPTVGLYHNDGSGRFVDKTRGSGLDVSFYGMGVAAADYDNDGFTDVFISAVGRNRLFHNNGNGTFTDVTEQAGVAGAESEWSTSCAWIDYNRDGLLDLFVCNYVRWSREIDFEVDYRLVGVGRAYGQPMNFEGTFPYLYRNDGNGRFTDVSAASGVQVRNSATGVPAAKALGVTPVDVDSDGWIDLVVANDTVQNYVFHNQQDGTFKEVGAIAGVAFDSNGLTRGAMGIDSGKFRNDDSLGILIGNFANEMTALYVSQSTPGPRAFPIFTDEAITEGIGPASRLLLKFGIFFFDYDLDGRLDVLTANGHLEDEISKIQQSQTYAQPAQLFWNAGPQQAGCFLPVPAAKAGTDLFRPIVGRGSAFADIDSDGDLDVVLMQTGGPPVLLRNDQQLEHHWIRLKLTGKGGNRDAIGAWVRTRVGGQTVSRQVMPTRGYLSQSELPVTLGLGAIDQLESVTILWPSGTEQVLGPESVRLDAVTIVEEPENPGKLAGL
ncbi:MAG: CRTAC1 family protein [Verrucomicrobiia bacterium]